MKTKHPVFAASIALALVIGPAGAQSPEKSPSTELRVTREGADGTEATRTDAKTAVTTLTNAELRPMGEEVRAQLTDLMKEPDAKGIEIVEMIGRVRGLDAQNGLVGQVVWYGLAATVEEEHRQAALEFPMKSSFLAKQPKVTERTRLEAQGDVDALKAAALALIATDDKEKDGEDGEDGEEEDGKDGAPGGKDRITGGSGSGGGNDVADDYKPLDLEDRTDSEDPIFEQVTSEGCEPRVDMFAGVVIITSKQVTTQGGKVINESDCTDSLDRYNIQKSYAGCSDDVDVSAMRARPQFRPFWVSENGTTHYITDCQPDTEEAFEITADYTACTPIVEMQAMRVVEAYELVYTNRQGVTNTVKACTADATRVIPLQLTSDGCSMRHDLSSNVSYEQGRYFYRRDGVEVAVSACGDMETLEHHIDYADCSPIVDLASKIVVPRGRRYVETDTGAVTIAECAPQPDQQSALQETRDGCEDYFVHNIPARQSLRTSRFYHAVTGQRTYVTDCAADGSAPIGHQEAIVAWQNNDQQKSSLPLTRLYFNDAGREIEVSGAQVRSGAVAVPYVFVESKTVDDSENISYQGCNKIVPTLIVETYERADQTTVQYTTGAGTPRAPVDECSRSTENRTEYVHTTFARRGSGTIYLCQGTSGNPCINARSAGGGGSPLNMGAGALEYLACSVQGGDGSTNSFTHYTQAQQRTITTYPAAAGGQTTTGNWTNQGSPTPAGSGACSSTPGE